MSIFSWFPWCFKTILIVSVVTLEVYICWNTLVKCHVSTFGLLKLLVQFMVVFKFNRLSMIYHMSGCVVFPILVYSYSRFSYSRLVLFSFFFKFSAFSYSRYISLPRLVPITGVSVSYSRLIFIGLLEFVVLVTVLVLCMCYLIWGGYLAGWIQIRYVFVVLSRLA